MASENTVVFFCFVLFYLWALANMRNLVWYKLNFYRSAVKNRMQMSCSSEQMWLGVSGRNHLRNSSVAGGPKGKVGEVHSGDLSMGIS